MHVVHALHHPGIDHRTHYKSCERSTGNARSESEDKIERLCTFPEIRSRKDGSNTAKGYYQEIHREACPYHPACGREAIHLGGDISNNIGNRETEKTRSDTDRAKTDQLCLEDV